MPDRLDELKRQRALVAEHLQWLDREILRAAGVEPPPAPAGPATPQLATTPAVSAPPTKPAAVAMPDVASGGVPPAPSVTPSPAALASSAALPAPLPEPELPKLTPAAQQDIHAEMKRGCFWWVAVAFLAVVLAFGLMWFFGRMYRPAPKEKPAVESRR